uniref:Uncharacterized protein n=1 Tax=Vespula pensylvanica TaxID=30213 RepID=A0A834KQJ8_VESPE|nr:hypothetical protein H0235_013614 [Vespula pensylvanica]
MQLKNIEVEGEFTLCVTRLRYPPCTYNRNEKKRGNEKRGMEREGLGLRLEVRGWGWSRKGVRGDIRREERGVLRENSVRRIRNKRGNYTEGKVGVDEEEKRREEEEEEEGVGVRGGL